MSGAPVSGADYPSICRTVRFDAVARPGQAIAKRARWSIQPLSDVRPRRLVVAKSVGWSAIRYNLVTTVTV
jgi:hypothetical protein